MTAERTTTQGGVDPGARLPVSSGPAPAGRHGPRRAGQWRGRRCGVSWHTGDLVERFAQAKASAVAEGVDEGLVVGCDLEFDGRCTASPDPQRSRWHVERSCSGRSGVFHTGHCVIDAASGRFRSAVSSRTVRFGQPAEDETAGLSPTEPHARRTAGTRKSVVRPPVS
ncbi:Maf family protein [Actinoallomurus sp. CA-142502]|uniref:Maf family protein n=1 Tax=Actinoallomurus sp. CA-142502 TaxID=3239885 RepID=UPI003D8AF462